MSEPVRMTFRHVKRSPALEQCIRAGAEKLRAVCGGDIHCDVVIEPLHGHGEVAPLCIRLHVHGARKNLSLERAGLDALGRRDAYVAVREIFDAARRSLQSAAVPTTRGAPRLAALGGYDVAQAS